MRDPFVLLVAGGTVALVLAALLEPLALVPAALIPFVAAYSTRAHRQRFRFLAALAFPPILMILHVLNPAAAPDVPGGTVLVTWATIAAGAYAVALGLAFVLDPSREDALLTAPHGRGWAWCLVGAGTGPLVGFVAAGTGGLPKLPFLPHVKLAVAPVLVVIVLAVVTEWLIRGPLFQWARAMMPWAGALGITALFTGALFSLRSPTVPAFVVGAVAGAAWGFLNMRASTLVPSALAAGSASATALVVS